MLLLEATNHLQTILTNMQPSSKEREAKERQGKERQGKKKKGKELYINEFGCTLVKIDPPQDAHLELPKLLLLRLRAARRVHSLQCAQFLLAALLLSCMHAHPLAPPRPPAFLSPPSSARSPRCTDSLPLPLPPPHGAPRPFTFHTVQRSFVNSLCIMSNAMVQRGWCADRWGRLGLYDDVWSEREAC